MMDKRKLMRGYSEVVLVNLSFLGALFLLFLFCNIHRFLRSGRLLQ